MEVYYLAALKIYLFTAQKTDRMSSIQGFSRSKFRLAAKLLQHVFMKNSFLFKSIYIKFYTILRTTI